MQIKLISAENTAKQNLQLSKFKTNNCCLLIKLFKTSKVYIYIFDFIDFNLITCTTLNTRFNKID